MIFLWKVKHSRIIKNENVTILTLWREVRDRETVTSCGKADVQ